MLPDIPVTGMVLWLASCTLCTQYTGCLIATGRSLQDVDEGWSPPCNLEKAQSGILWANHISRCGGEPLPSRAGDTISLRRWVRCGWLSPSGTLFSAPISAFERRHTYRNFQSICYFAQSTWSATRMTNYINPPSWEASPELQDDRSRPNFAETPRSRRLDPSVAGVQRPHNSRDAASGLVAMHDGNSEQSEANTGMGEPQ